jgi:TRAP-type C4-dicarboxylate transport system substrate-binding protein
MEALSLTPVSLPLTDVLTGLQTGLIDIVAMSPVGALVLQWHTKVKYVTEIPLVYTLGFMALDKRAFDKISEADQAIVRDVMERTYRNFDKQNLIDNREAFEALLNTGIESVPINMEEYEKVREKLLESNRELGEQGLFTLELYDEMMRYVEEYRSEQQASAGPSH